MLLSSLALRFDAMTHKVMANFVGKFSNDCYLVSVQVEQKINDTKSQLIDLTDLLIQAKHVLSSGKTRKFQIVEKKPPPPPTAVATSASSAKRAVVSIDKPISVSVAAEHVPTLKKYVSSEFELKKKEKHEFFITHIEDMSEFYVQVSDSKNETFRALMADMQYFYTRKSNLPMPLYQNENACVFYDDEKKCWHRAQIVKILNEISCVIYFIDIGQQRVVKKTQLRDIYEKYLTLTAQVAQASLDDVKDLKVEDIDELIQFRFKDIALGKQLLGRVVDVVPNTTPDATTQNKYLINLFGPDCESVYVTLTQGIF